MKKILLLLTLLFQFIIAFGQQNCVESGCAANNRIMRCWGNIQTFTDIPGIQVRVRGPIEDCFNAINDEPNKHSYRWVIEMKGTTNCLYNLEVTDANGKTMCYGHSIVGENIVSWEIAQKDINEQNAINVKGSVLDFLTFSNAATIYVQLVKKYSTFRKTGKSNAESTLFPANRDGGATKSPTANSNNRQNDLTEYNRSKQEMEEKLAQKNAEIQRQNQDNLKKRQQFVSVYNEGVALGNTGRYADAAAKYQQAIGIATNDTDRQTAQNAYNKVNKTATQTQAVGQLATLVTGAANFYQRAKAEKQERDRITAEKIKKNNEEYTAKQAEYAIQNDLRKEKEAIKSINTLSDTREFDASCDFLAMGLARLDFKLDSLALYQLTPNSRSVALIYNGLKVIVSHTFRTFRNEPNKPSYNMDKMIAITAESPVLAAAIENSDLHTLLKSYSEHYFRKGNTLYYSPYQLEKDASFIDVYRNGYSSANYKGIRYYMSKFEFDAQETFAKSDETIENLRKKGELYMMGKGVIQDYAKALPFFTKASAMGDSISMAIIGSMYRFGDETLQKDSPKSIEWTQKAIDHGNADAYSLLSTAYKYGFGVNIDLNKAIALLELGVAKSSLQCMRNLSNLYNKGDGVTKDRNKAIALMEKACEIGRQRRQLGYCESLKDLLAGQ
ncbi:MAG: tetratricopeptide repeat protein [Mucilaginibacter sp.]